MKTLNKIVEVILEIFVACMVLGCLWQVTTRFILHNPSKYTEEFLRYMLIWLTLIGVPYAYGKDRHLSMTFVIKKCSQKSQVIDCLAVDLLVMILSITVMIIGGTLVTINATGQLSPAMQIPMQFYYGCVPISGCLMVVYGIERMIKHVRELKTIIVNESKSSKKTDNNFTKKVKTNHVA